MAIKFTQVVDFANQRLTSVSSPSAGTDAVNKDYVDSAIQGLSWKESVRVATTGAVNMNGPGDTIDGVTMAVNDRFLIKDQANPLSNGIYVWNGANVLPTRATDADSDSDLRQMAVSVEAGTVNGDKTYLLITDGPITVDTTPLVYTLLAGGGGGAFTAGAGLTLTGSELDVGQGTGIIVGTDSVSIDTAVVTRKYAVNIGDGGSTTITITHGFGTRDVQVQVYTNESPWDTVWCEVQRGDANTVNLLFGTAPAVAAYRAVVNG